MRRYYEKEESYRYSDLTNTHLGYWTDNGKLSSLIDTDCTDAVGNSF